MTREELKKMSPKERTKFLKAQKKINKEYIKKEREKRRKERGYRFQQFRERRRFTQSALADWLVVNVNTVIAWERGRNDPDIDTLIQLCYLYKIDMDQLIGNVDEEDDLLKPTPEEQEEINEAAESYLAMIERPDPDRD